MLTKSGSIVHQYTNIYNLNNRSMSFPIFQRFYSWKETQIRELKSDIINAIDQKDKEIYLLDIIWYEEDGTMKIADGQQRIVTLNLLFRSINEYISTNNLRISEIKPFDLVYDNVEYNKLYKKSSGNLIQAPFKKIFLNLKSFVEENQDQLEEIIDILQNRICVNLKKTSSPDEAFSIFTQINTGGKPLTKDEVIKTAIDQYSVIYRHPIVSNLKDLRKTITSYYKIINDSHTGEFDSIEIMRFIKEIVVKSKESFVDFAKNISIVSQVDSYSISYIIKYINRPQLFDILNVMVIKGIDLKIKKDYLTMIMFPLCLLSVIMSFKKSNPGGIIKVLYQNVIKMIKDGSKVGDISSQIATFINNNPEICKIYFEDFVSSLGKREVKNKIKEALLLMDVIRKTTSSDLNVPSINLEHIYPQKPEIQWVSQGWPTDIEEHLEIVNNIGNYLLLNEQVNKSIKNKYIDKKIDEYNRIIPNDITLQTEINTVDFERFTREKKEYILYRQRQIAELIYENFVLAKVLIIK